MSELSEKHHNADQVGRTGIYPASGPPPPGPAPIRGQGEFGHPEEHRRLLEAPRRDGAGVWLALGRALYGGYFLYNGINHFANWRAMSDYAKSKAVPLPGFAVCASGALIVGGGLSLLSGVRPRAGASMIAVFLLGVSPRMHAFWNIHDSQERTNEMINFTKNMALIGAACFAAALPEPWPGRFPSAAH
jgi:putative oxidoreductase